MMEFILLSYFHKNSVTSCNNYKNCDYFIFIDDYWQLLLILDDYSFLLITIIDYYWWLLIFIDNYYWLLIIIIDYWLLFLLWWLLKKIVIR